MNCTCTWIQTVGERECIILLMYLQNIQIILTFFCFHSKVNFRCKFYSAPPKKIR